MIDSKHLKSNIPSSKLLETPQEFRWGLSGDFSIPSTGKVETDRNVGVFECADIRLSLISADTTTIISVDVLKNGTSLFEVPVTIPISGTTSVGGTPFIFISSATTISFYDDDIIDFVVSGATDGLGLKVRLIGNNIIYDIPPELNLSGLVAYFGTKTIDETAINENDLINSWSDATGITSDVTQTSTLRPLLHINPTTLKREVDFSNGTDWLQGSASDLNFVAGVDEFTIVVKVGDIPSFQGYWISKASSTAADRQWGIYNFDDFVATFLRGVDSDGAAEQSNYTIQANDTVIWTVSTTLQNIRVNGTAALTDRAVSTANGSVTTHPVEMGTRSSGGFLNDGSVSYIAVYDRVLNEQEKTTIYGL